LGNVTDTSQAPVTDCQVTATSIQTGQQLTVQTLDSGLYTFASLPAGTYNITVQKQGFKQSAVQGVVLDAASSRTVNFSLQLGTVNESVTVSAESDQIQNTSGDVGRLLSERQLSRIALNRALGIWIPGRRVRPALPSLHPLDAHYGLKDYALSRAVFSDRVLACQSGL
jgi:hypothetical protein